MMRVFDCTDLDVDGTTCLTGQWVEFTPGAWESLQMADVEILAAATIALFAVAFIVRVIRRSM